MNTQTTTRSRFFQLIALVFVLVAVSACSKKEGSTASVRNRNGRAGTITPTSGNPGTLNSTGAINSSQIAIEQFLGVDPYSNNGQLLGAIQRVTLEGRVAVSPQATGTAQGGSLVIRIVDSLAQTNGGEIQAYFDNCRSEIQNNSWARVICYDQSGDIQFEGQIRQGLFQGTIRYDVERGQGQNLGNFSIDAYAFFSL